MHMNIRPQETARAELNFHARFIRVPSKGWSIMNLKKIIAGAVFLVVAGGVAWIVTAEAPVRQEAVSKTIPNERFFNNQNAQP